VIILIVALAAGVAVRTAAQTKRPDFSGAWQADRDASKALTEKNGGEWRVAGASSGAGAAAQPPAGARIMQPLTLITQSASEIVFERQLDGEIYSREVHKLDGSASVNAARNSTTRSTTVWKGSSLVTTGTTTLDFSDGSARDAAGNLIPEIVRDFVTTRTLMPDGTMQVVTRTTEKGRPERVSWSVLVPVKTK
jgi:hypothetical protein